ncbi:10032_t:CDS:2 [Rhizophagus irregularis]|nr:10032_t:CDS:2 [Rhizophagus irregularis]
MICLDKIKEEEFDENEKEIIDIDSDSADELDELEDDELNNDLQIK